MYREHPAVAAAAESRSEALEAEDPLAAERQVHWQIHRAHLDYQDAAEQRRQLGWSEQQARNAKIRNAKISSPGRRTSGER